MAIASGFGVNNEKSHDFLLQPTEITKVVIDFKKTDLPEYDGLYATVLDNVFSEQACQTLISMAESSTGGEWEEAMVNVGNGKQRTIKDTRDCGRIIWDDFNMVATIWARIKDQVPEILTLKNQSHITGYGPVRRNETWKMSRLNERMRFLKYQEDQYFRRKYNCAFPSPLQNMNLICAFQRTRTAPMYLLTAKKSRSTRSIFISMRTQAAEEPRPSTLTTSTASSTSNPNQVGCSSSSTVASSTRVQTSHGGQSTQCVQI